jgi:lipoyl(octanoyl) transferase
VDRGGKITWHGPGQLVAYPVIPLRLPLDVIEYLRRLEQAAIAACGAVRVPAGVIAGRSGVWVGDIGVPQAARKVCAVGARVAQGITMHGLALNCAPDLAMFEKIVPCGIDDAAVTSLTVETGRLVTVAEMRPLLSAALVSALLPQLLGS